MVEQWTVRPYQAGDEQGILPLFNAVFAEGNPTFEPRTLAHWHWLFRDNPLGHHTWVAVNAGGAIVGNYASIPGLWLHHGEPMIGAQAVDTCVAAEYRRVLKREGLFLSLAAAYFDQYGRADRDRIIYGFPNPVAWRIGTRRLDYRPVHTPVRALVRDFAQDWIDYLGPMGADRVLVEEVARFPDDTAALADAMHADLLLVQRRDLAYLRWRYEACPTHRYRILTARAAGELRGVLVMRTSWFDRPLAPLVDWVVRGDDREALCGLARHAALLAREHGKARLETWLPPWSRHAAGLKTIGFAEDDSNFNLCIRVFGPAFDEQWAARHWFYAMGDSDVY